MKIKTIITLLIFAVAIIGIIAPVSATISSVDKENKGYLVESKEKTVKLKITWNANGGKIGSKKTISTSVKKGSKIGKLVTTPKRSGYSFKGWYTKKIAGSKISKNTVAKKSITYFAQWKKKPTALENKLLGGWVSTTIVTNRYTDSYYFRNNGTYTRSYTTVLINAGTGRITGIYTNSYNGSWSASGNTVFLKDIKYRTAGMDPGYWESQPDTSFKINNFGSDEKGQFFTTGDNNRKFYKT